MDARELDDTILSRIPEESSTTKCNCWLVGWQLGKRPQSSPVIIYIAHKFKLGDVNKTIISFGSTTKCNCWLVGWQLIKKPHSSPAIIYKVVILGDVN